jgi:N-acetylmuramoyl-L-alanine amidase
MNFVPLVRNMKVPIILFCVGTLIAAPAWAEQPLFVAYPPDRHETTADRIFLIGTAPAKGEVTVNGQPIQRSAAGHFAPSFPLQVGENRFQLRYQSQELQINVMRNATAPVVPTGLAFAPSSLQPAVNMSRLPGELICFAAIAPANAVVSVKLGDRNIALPPRQRTQELPPNSAVLTQQNQPTQQSIAGHYEGCAKAVVPGSLGQPQFRLTVGKQTMSQAAPGNVDILEPSKLQVAEVTAESGVARTGPSTDHSRLTPLPKGTQATITGREGDWLRLDYGGWIKVEEVQILESAVPPRSLIRSVTSRSVTGWTEVVFPLEVPVPVTVEQEKSTLVLTLHNTTAQTDTIKLNDDLLIERLDWQQIAPGQVRYAFRLKTAQQWGYKLRYDGTSLILSLRHPPTPAKTARTVKVRPRVGIGFGTGGIGVNIGNFGIGWGDLGWHDRNDLWWNHVGVGVNIKTGAGAPKPLQGMTILLDPGHGSQNDLGARGPTGYPEKDVALIVSKLIRTALEQRGATVLMTREDDQDLLPQDRVALINKLEPTIALSLHYNALPDNGDALNTQGISAFWYNTQAHSLAVFLHNYLVTTLKRPSYGVFWNNLALTRPTIAPAVLLELGFMINPEEFEWIINPQAQQQLAQAIAAGVTEWVEITSISRTRVKHRSSSLRDR